MRRHAMPIVWIALAGCVPTIDRTVGHDAGADIPGSSVVGEGGGGGGSVLPVGAGGRVLVGSGGVPGGALGTGGGGTVVVGSGGVAGAGGAQSTGAGSGAVGSGGRVVVGSGGAGGSGGMSATGSGGRVPVGSGGVPGAGGAVAQGSGGRAVVGSGGVSGSGGAVTMWIPATNTSWQWQLTGTVDQSVDASMFDVDLFDNDATVVTALHAKGRKVVCYISAGTFEDWRTDAGSFPAAVKGNAVDGWAGEAWLDIRQLSTLGPIIAARLDLCKAKGFDAVEFDNVDGYSNDSGFPLTAADQLAYNRYLARAAHQRGLSAGLKNDLDQVPDLVGDFDWALNEQCFQYKECALLQPFVKAGKAVFNVEYTMATAAFCADANAMNFNSLRKKLALDAYRVPCR